MWRAEAAGDSPGDAHDGLVTQPDLLVNPTRAETVKAGMRVGVVPNLVPLARHGECGLGILLHIAAQHEESGGNLGASEGPEDRLRDPGIRAVVEGEIRDHLAGAACDYWAINRAVGVVCAPKTGGDGERRADRDRIDHSRTRR
jgi:hypothetical protein